MLITKDTDFANSFLVAARPPKLLLISTGNISNLALEAMFVPTIPRIVEALKTHDFVELSRQALITHA